MRETYMCIVFATICLGCSAHSAHAQDTKTAPLVFSESIPVAQTQDVDVRNVRLVGAAPKNVALGTKKSSLTITPGKYWLGGAIGSVAGFGIGHAIVGEYGSMGWIFTLTELLALSIPVVAAGITAIAIWDGEGINTTFDQIIDTWSVFLWIGLGLYAALRVWEIIDLWTRPKVKWPGQTTKTSAVTNMMLVPTFSPTGAGLSFQLSF